MTCNDGHYRGGPGGEGWGSGAGAHLSVTLTTTTLDSLITFSERYVIMSGPAMSLWYTAQL